MNTITTKISDSLNERLENLAQIIERNKSYLLRKAIEYFLDEKEEYLISVHRLEQKGKPIEELEKASNISQPVTENKIEKIYNQDEENS